LIRIVLIHTGIALNLAIQASLSARADYYCIQIKLITDLFLPLLAEVGQTNHCEAGDLSALHKLSCEQQGLNRLPHPDIVCYEKPHYRLS
jgi:hypothetical protein